MAEEAGAAYAAMHVEARLEQLLQELGRVRQVIYGEKSCQNRVLETLAASGVMLQRELTMRLGIRPGSSSEVLRKLEQAGLIERVPSAEDRRQSCVSLTEAGAARSEELRAGRRLEQETLFSALAAEERARLLELLEKVASDWGLTGGSAGHL